MIELPRGIHMPRYKVIEFEQGRRSFQGDYTDFKIIEFKTLPSEEFYKILESLSTLRGSRWSLSYKDTVTIYRYGTSWQKGRFVTRGHFNITVIKGDKLSEIKL